MLQSSGIWADVMRMGVQGENDQDDSEWWIAHQQKIEFAFGVLSGLGLANRGGVAEDGTFVWNPSNKMKRLHRYGRAYYDYRRARDKQLIAEVRSLASHAPGLYRKRKDYDRDVLLAVPPAVAGV